MVFGFFFHKGTKTHFKEFLWELGIGHAKFLQTVGIQLKEAINIHNYQFRRYQGKREKLQLASAVLLDFNSKSLKSSGARKWHKSVIN